MNLLKVEVRFIKTSLYLPTFFLISYLYNIIIYLGILNLQNQETLLK